MCSSKEHALYRTELGAAQVTEYHTKTTQVWGTSATQVHTSTTQVQHNTHIYSAPTTPQPLPSLSPPVEGAEISTTRISMSRLVTNILLPEMKICNED